MAGITQGRSLFTRGGGAVTSRVGRPETQPDQLGGNPAMKLLGKSDKASNDPAGDPTAASSAATAHHGRAGANPVGLAGGGPAGGGAADGGGPAGDGAADGGARGSGGAA